VWVLFIGCTELSLLFFPDGHLPDSRWKWLAWLTLLLTSVGAVWQAFSPGVIVSLGTIRNPLGIEGLSKANDPVQAIMFALMFVAVVSSLLVRLRRARGSSASRSSGRLILR
jgi:cbb3-type cytochrome oxidase subunit 3